MRGFSDEERARIREELLATGREQFFRYGPERTRVKDITDPVGIAKPTFYQFFDSKGELYLEVVAREIEAFDERARAGLEATEDPHEGLTHLFESYAEFIERNPDLQEVLTETHSRELFRNVPQERIDEVRRQWRDAYLPLIETLQENSDGALATYEPDVVLGLLRPVGLMQWYRERGTTLSDEEFERIRRAHIETLVRGLVLAETDR